MANFCNANGLKSKWPTSYKTEFQPHTIGNSSNFLFNFHGTSFIAQHFKLLQLAFFVITVERTAIALFLQRRRGCFDCNKYLVNGLFKGLKLTLSSWVLVHSLVKKVLLVCTKNAHHMVEEFLHASSDIKLPVRGHPLSGPGFFFNLLFLTFREW